MASHPPSVSYYEDLQRVNSDERSYRSLDNYVGPLPMYVSVVYLNIWVQCFCWPLLLTYHHSSVNKFIESTRSILRCWIDGVSESHLKNLKTCNVQQISNNWCTSQNAPYKQQLLLPPFLWMLQQIVYVYRFSLSHIMNCQTWVSDFRLRHRPMQDLGLHVSNSYTVQNTRSVGPVMECNNRRLIVTCSIAVVLTLLMSVASLTLTTIQLKYPQLLGGEINNKMKHVQNCSWVRYSL